MLVVTRKPGEKIVIGDGIALSLVSIKGGQVRLAVDAPRDVRILREELEKHAFPVPADPLPADPQPTAQASPVRKPFAPKAAAPRAAVN